MAYTYDITIRCKTPEERDIVLETIDEGVADSQSKNLIELGIVRYRGENPNTYFSESDGGVKTRYSESVIIGVKLFISTMVIIRLAFRASLKRLARKSTCVS